MSLSSAWALCLTSMPPFFTPLCREDMHLMGDGGARADGVHCDQP